MQLGVDTTPSPRRNDANQPLPEGYAPFGSSWELSKTSELLLLGVDSVTAGEPFAVLDLTDGNGNAAQTKLLGKTRSSASWAVDSRPSRGAYAPRRIAVAADDDGDGYEELIVAYLDAGNLHLLRIEDLESGFAETDQLLGPAAEVSSLVLAAGDLDGDGRDELLLGTLRAARADVQVFRRGSARYDAQAQSITLAANLRAATSLNLRLAVGNLDDDRSEEFALVLNEQDSVSGATASRYSVHDDLGTQLAQLAADLFVGADQNGQTRVVAVGDVAIGNLDADAPGEVVLGGMLETARNCATLRRFALVLDRDTSWQKRPGHYFTENISNCSSSSPPRFQFTFVGCVDLDGDGRSEIALDRHVFDDFATSQSWTPLPDYTLPQSVLYAQGQFGHYDLSTVSFAYGDFTGDDRADVAVHRQDTREIAVWGVPGTGTQIVKLRTVPVAFHNSQTPMQPQLVAVNVDRDSAVLRYDEGRYQLVFSEPILLAALAAPPHAEGVGQNVAACVTTFGNTTQAGQERERSVTVTASATVGFKVDDVFTQSGVEFRATATATAQRTTSRAYTLSKTILFTSGATEDTVVFTTIPIDRYTYTILSHPDPLLVGREVVANFPRDPITLQAERSFYNANVQTGGTRIDSSIFSHRIGDTRSYPTPTARDRKLGGNRSLQVGPISVGQGTGQTELQLVVGEEIATGRSLEFGFEVELEATGATLLGGVSIGSSVANTVKITSGRATTYTGIVGALPASAFASSRYQFGLYTYVHRDPRTGQQFQVIDYWVE